MTLPITGLSPNMSHERVFRDFWLPAVGVNQAEIKGIALPILRDLYPGVYEWGPCVEDWVSWKSAIMAELAHLRLTEDETVWGQLPDLVFVNELVATYGSTNNMGMQWARLDLLPDGYLPNLPGWLKPVEYLRRNLEHEEFVGVIYDTVQPHTSGSHLNEALTRAGQFILLRYLPVKNTAALKTRAHQWYDIHNQFAAKWHLPQLPVTI